MTFANPVAGVAREHHAQLAIQAAERALEMDPDLPEAHLALGLYYDRCLGDAERPMEEFRKVAEVRPNEPLMHFSIGASLFRQGNLDQAVDRIEHFLSTPGTVGDTLTVAVLRTHPDWDPLRDHPRFAEILARYDTER